MTMTKSDRVLELRRRNPRWTIAKIAAKAGCHPAYAGQVVRPGDPVLTLISTRAEQIVAWLDETSFDRLRRRRNLEATVIQAHDGRRLHAACPVVRIGPAVVPLPEELWPSPTRPVRGRPVVLGIPAGVDLAPGELVTVRWN